MLGVEEVEGLKRLNAVPWNVRAHNLIWPVESWELKSGMPSRGTSEAITLLRSNKEPEVESSPTSNPSTPQPLNLQTSPQNLNPMPIWMFTTSTLLVSF